MVVMYYILDSHFNKKYISKKLVGRLKKLGYKVYKERLL